MKKMISLLLCLLLLPVLMVQADTPLVLDYAGVLSSQEATALAGQAQELKSAYGLDIVVLTTDTIMGNPTPESYADDFFDANYGNNGILFLLDMGSRSWHISTAGTASKLLSDDDLMKVEDAVIPWFSDGFFYKGFHVFLEMLPDLLEPEEKSSLGELLLMCTIPGAFFAAIALAVMVGTMNTKKPQHSAADYTVDGSFHLRTHQDLFLYSSLSKRAKPKENKSGSTTHTSSSGRSHGGRGGKF